MYSAPTVTGVDRFTFLHYTLFAQPTVFGSTVFYTWDYN